MIKDIEQRNKKGQFVKGYKHSEKWKKYISEKMKGRKITWASKISKSLIGHKGLKGKANPFYGKKHTEEIKRKISEAAKKRKVLRGKWHHLYGRKLSKERKKKIGEKIKALGIRPPITKGKNHYCWKGGITPLVEKIRKCSKYRQWRFDVFRKDNFTCQQCEERGCYLEADHYPTKFTLILEKYKIKSLEEALSCGELWDINNGRTLCQKCHNKTKSL